MRENPLHALNALLTRPAETSGMPVFPLTVYRYALLDLIESPLLGSGGELDFMKIIVSIFIMTRGNEELKKYGFQNIYVLYTDTLRWAKKWKNIRKIRKNAKNIMKLLTEQLKNLKYLIPDDNQENRHVSGTISTNGWLTQLVYNTCKNFSGNIDYVMHEMPLTQLFLLYRQQQYNESHGKTLTLSDKETIDGMENGR